MNKRIGTVVFIVALVWGFLGFLVGHTVGHDEATEACVVRSLT